MSKAELVVEKNITDSLSLVALTEEVLQDFLPFIGLSRNDLTIGKVKIKDEVKGGSVRYKQHLNGVFFSIQPGGILISYSEGTSGSLKIFNKTSPNVNISTIPSITLDEAAERESGEGKLITNYEL